MCPERLTVRTAMNPSWERRNRKGADAIDAIRAPWRRLCAGPQNRRHAESRSAPRLAGNLAASTAEPHLDANPAPALTTQTPGKRPAVIAGITLINPPKPSASADTVGRFMLACLKRAPGEEAQGGAIYVRYWCWCGEQQPALTALDPRSFAQQFAERCERVGIRTRRNGRWIYCLDVKLVA